MVKTETHATDRGLTLCLQENVRLCRAEIRALNHFVDLTFIIPFQPFIFAFLAGSTSSATLCVYIFESSTLEALSLPKLLKMEESSQPVFFFDIDNCLYPRSP
jgi:hypothetical protein